jgi:hypothetical protein
VLRIATITYAGIHVAKDTCGNLDSRLEHHVANAVLILSGLVPIVLVVGICWRLRRSLFPPPTLGTISTKPG